MTPYEYLSSHTKATPEWIERFKVGGAVSRKQFFASPVVYYPGSGSDGHPVKVFGSTHSAHTFVYADYGKTRAEIEADLASSCRGVRGYHTLDRLELDGWNLDPTEWSTHIDAASAPAARHRSRACTASFFGFVEVLQRNQALANDHGPRRLAILFIGADGIAAYEGLFCRDRAPPFAVVLADHGFGGNYDRFGRGGLLESIARYRRCFPEWLLVAENTVPWDGFAAVPGVDSDCGGMHVTPRFLYARTGS